MMYINNIFKYRKCSVYAFVLLTVLSVSTLLNAQTSVLIKDINPGKPSSSPKNFTEFGGNLFFNTAKTTGLWMTDGTEMGTMQPQNMISQTALNHSISNDFVSKLTVFNRQLFFNTRMKHSWWKITEELGDAVKIIDKFNFIQGVSYDSTTLGSEVLVFAGQDFNVSNSPINLYSTDVNGDNLYSLGSFVSDSNGSSPKGFKKLNSQLIFSAVESDTGREIYSTDATTGSTYLIKDINPGQGDGLSDIKGLDDGVVLGNKLCFSAFSNAPYGTKLWCTDGTTAGTVALYDEQGVLSRSQADYDSPQNLTILNGFIYFFASVGNSSRLQLWRATTSWRDPTMPVHPTQVTFDSDLNLSYGEYECDGELEPVVVDNVMYFPREDNKNGCELWISDGTTTGTGVLKDINTGDMGSAPVLMGVFNGELYFSAFQNEYGKELWRTNGKKYGTQMVGDLNPGPSGSITNNEMVIYNGAPYYIADNGMHGQELFKVSFAVADLIFSSGFE